jgi:asparagine synthase (glutamine-hydrolysing)
MCGIFGIASRNLSSDSSQRLRLAASTLKNRGPDDLGIDIYKLSNSEVAFGHTRLSIIDLTIAGHQPMNSSDARFSIIFNGEIYNYKELRCELIKYGFIFNSDSDTGVLLAAWQHWGVDCLERLIGMFAFVVLDKNKETLTFVRDAFGIKPIFLSLGQSEIFFASELPAICKLAGRSANLNLQRAYDYLVHSDYDTQQTTFIEGVDQLEPGHFAIYDLKNSTIEPSVKWWNPSVEQTSSLSFNQAAEKLREIFLQSINYHLRSDVPLGTALSGGVDSSAVVCAIRHLKPDLPIHTFSFLAKNSPISEEKWIDLVVNQVGAISHTVNVNPEELARDLDDMIIAQGEPFGSTSIYAQYRVFQLAKSSGVTVTLDGQGADELLAGYRGYPGKRIKSMLEIGDLSGAVNFLYQWSKWPDRPLSVGVKLFIAEFMNEPLYQALMALNGGNVCPSWINGDKLKAAGVKLIFPRMPSTKSSGGRRLMADLNTASNRYGLPGLLRHADRNSMRFSVESRVPFLNTELAKFIFTLPEEYLISQQGETKSVFKAAMRGIVPDEILNRRDKIGFATPEQDWLVQLAPQARQWIVDSEPLPWINKQEMLNEFDAIIAGQIPFSWQAWRFINFSRWYALVFRDLSVA